MEYHLKRISSQYLAGSSPIFNGSVLKSLNACQNSFIQAIGQEMAVLANPMLFLVSVTSAHVKEDVLHCLCFCSLCKCN